MYYQPRAFFETLGAQLFVLKKLHVLLSLTQVFLVFFTMNNEDFSDVLVKLQGIVDEVVNNHASQTEPTKEYLASLKNKANYWSTAVYIAHNNAITTAFNKGVNDAKAELANNSLFIKILKDKSNASQEDYSAFFDVVYAFVHNSSQEESNSQNSSNGAADSNCDSSETVPSASRKDQPQVQGTESTRRNSSSHNDHAEATESFSDYLESVVAENHLDNSDPKSKYNEKTAKAKNAHNEASKKLGPKPSKRSSKKQKKAEHTYNFKKIFTNLFNSMRKDSAEHNADTLWNKFVQSGKCPYCDHEGEVIKLTVDDPANFIINASVFLSEHIKCTNPLSYYYCKECNKVFSDFDKTLDYPFIPGSKFGISCLVSSTYDLVDKLVAKNKTFTSIKDFDSISHNELNLALFNFSYTTFGPISCFIQALFEHCINIHVDETTASIRQAENKFKDCSQTDADKHDGKFETIQSGSKPYISTCCTNDNSLLKQVCYKYAPGRSNALLSDAFDYLCNTDVNHALDTGKLSALNAIVSDAFHFYDTLSDDLNIKHQKCLVHARREFYISGNPKDYIAYLKKLSFDDRKEFLKDKLESNNPQLVCNIICSLINLIFVLEADVQYALKCYNCKDFSEEARQDYWELAKELRGQHIRELFDYILELSKSYENQLYEQNSHKTGVNANSKSDIAKAFVYLINNKKDLQTAFDDPNIPIHNNPVELVARPIAKFRKINIDNVNVYHCTALLFALTVIETMTANGKEGKQALQAVAMESKSQLVASNIKDNLESGNFNLKPELIDNNTVNLGNQDDYMRYASQLNFDSILPLIFDEDSLNFIKQLDLQEICDKARKYYINYLRDLHDSELRSTFVKMEKYANEAQEIDQVLAQAQAQDGNDPTQSSSKDCNDSQRAVDSKAQINKQRGIRNNAKKAQTKMERVLNGYIAKARTPPLKGRESFGLTKHMDQRYQELDSKVNLLIKGFTNKLDNLRGMPFKDIINTYFMGQRPSMNHLKELKGTLKKRLKDYENHTIALEKSIVDNDPKLEGIYAKNCIFMAYETFKSLLSKTAKALHANDPISHEELKQILGAIYIYKDFLDRSWKNHKLAYNDIIKKANEYMSSIQSSYEKNKLKQSSNNEHIA